MEPAEHAGSQAPPGPTESDGEPSRVSACRVNCEKWWSNESPAPAVESQQEEEGERQNDLGGVQDGRLAVEFGPLNVLLGLHPR